MSRMIIAVDFDGTIVEMKYPEIGRDLGARYWLGCLHALRAEMVVWTCRTGASLLEMESWLEVQGFGEMFSGINTKPISAEFMKDDPRKIFASVYVDDRALGAPLKDDPHTNEPAYFDWNKAGPVLIKMVEAYNKARDEATDGS